jgi:hypothetical protein
MDQMELMQLLMGGGMRSNWMAVAAFFAVAAFYFAAPLVGYQRERRGMLLVSMYLCIGYVGMAIAQTALWYFASLESSWSSMRRQESLALILRAYDLLQSAVLVIAMILFAVGLQMLRPRQPAAGEPGVQASK